MTHSSARLQFAPGFFGHVRTVVLVVVLTAAVDPASGGSVSVTDAMAKIRRDDPEVAHGVTSIHLESARNEFEGFQIVIRGVATAVTARATALQGPNGAKLTAAACDVAGNVRLYHEVALQIGTSVADGGPVDPPPLSDPAGTGGWVPDALLPQVDEFENKCRSAFTFSVDANQNGVIWADIFVPDTAPPGEGVAPILITLQA